MKKKSNAFRYRVVIDWSEKDDCFVARVPELPGCATDGATFDEAAKNAQDAIEGYVATLKDLKQPLPEPASEKRFSGKIPLRIDPELHRDLYIEARASHLSLNKLIEERLRIKAETAEQDA